MHKLSNHQSTKRKCIWSLSKTRRRQTWAGLAKAMWLVARNLAWWLGAAPTSKREARASTMEIFALALKKIARHRRPMMRILAVGKKQHAIIYIFGSPKHAWAERGSARSAIKELLILPVNCSSGLLGSSQASQSKQIINASLVLAKHIKQCSTHSSLLSSR